VTYFTVCLTENSENIVTYFTQRLTFSWFEKSLTENLLFYLDYPNKL